MKPIKNVKQGRGKKYEYNGTVYDSKEEIYFLWYLQELSGAGYVDEFEYQPEPFPLSNAVPIRYFHCNAKTQKEKERNLLQPHSYQADFRIVWNSKAEDIFYGAERRGIDPFKPPFIVNHHELYFTAGIPFNISWVEIKPAHDKHNMSRIFDTRTQPWVYQLHGIYVQKVICVPMVTVGKKSLKIKYTPANALFVETFTPYRFRFTDGTMKKRKINFFAPDLESYIHTGGRMPF